MQPVKSKNLGTVKKTGARWGVLRCLYETLRDTSLDLHHFIQRDLDEAKAMIESGSPRTKNAEVLLDWVERKLREKAIFLDNPSYWEDLLTKAMKAELTKKEFQEVPFMKMLLETHEFLRFCTPDLGIEKSDSEMVLTEQKPFHEVMSMLRGYKNLVLVGCGLCATKTRTGGEEQVRDLIQRLKAEKTVLGFTVVESPCDIRVARRDMKKVRRCVVEAEAILTLCCNLGVETLASLTGKMVLPALNTRSDQSETQTGIAVPE